MGPAGIIRSTGQIVRLVKTEFDIEYPILLDARHTLFRLLARSLHHNNFLQGLDFMRSVLNMEYAILGLRRLLRSIEYQCVTCRKHNASTIQPIVSDISNHPLIIRVWITLDRFTFRFAEALKKNGDFFSLAPPPGLYTLRLYHFWTLVFVSWALNGSLRVVVHQARSGRITARFSLVRKRNYLPASRAGMAWLRPFLHTKMLLGNLTRQAHPIMAVPESASSKARTVRYPRQ